MDDIDGQTDKPFADVCYGMVKLNLREIPADAF